VSKAGSQRGAAAADVIGRLPHRPPFVFLSEVRELAPGDRAAAVWRLTGDEDFFAGHFPGRPVVPGVLIGEALAQLAGLVGFSGGDPTAQQAEAVSGAAPPAAPALLSQVNLKFLRPVTPPAEIALSAEWARSMGALSLFNVEARTGRHVVAHGSLTLAAPGEGA
jgi:3-hydroxyacyl-[acyl-carrier-protein] dehydratase